MCTKKMLWLGGWRGIAALMKASPTVIYDIGMSGMVTRPMGRAELRRYLDVSMDVRDQRAWEEGGHNSFAGVSFTKLQLMEMSLY